MPTTLRVHPLDRGDWEGRLVSVRDCPTTDFTEADVAEYLHEYQSADDWDGDVVGLWRLQDGRYVTFETFWGPTGDGFSADAYGGNADIHFASSYVDAVNFGLTDEGRRLLHLEPS
jgi:hypothetical protein